MVIKYELWPHSQAENHSPLIFENMNSHECQVLRVALRESVCNAGVLVIVEMLVFNLASCACCRRLRIRSSAGVLRRFKHQL